jgi:hypothetical protein
VVAWKADGGSAVLVCVLMEEGGRANRTRLVTGSKDWEVFDVSPREVGLYRGW